ncbi:glycosyltransferase family 4 protein [Zobellia uliginosa]|uniref:glycosyltransferase family 4 protein n=1 Tax=Zobellia uliginosa TaxID=143224 RepID=UPI001C06B837|nr:glycosyltransferase family 4 protein [Zobellia uliginosa]MBU2947825.1 glycosyltransferase family 4 protein [Zobellia uliginosa]
MKKRILFILHYPPPVHGAAMVGQYIRESDIINETFDAKYVNLSLSISVEEIGKNGFQKWSRYFKILWTSLRAIYNFKPNLVYLTLTSSGLGFYKDATIAVLAKLMGKKVVYHFHNKGVSKKNSPIKHFVNKIVFKNAKVILLSDYLYYDIEKYVTPNNVSYCPNGIPQIKNLEKREVRNNNKVELLFLSNLIESKGVFVLLDACKILVDKSIRFNCTFVGGEGDINAVEFNEKRSVLNLQNHVQYVGKKYGKEKEEIYFNSDIFVLPTYYDNECFPLVLLEAMQFSLPVVTTTEGGIREIVDDSSTGCIVSPLNAEELAIKLEELIVNPVKRIAMGEKGRMRYKENFTLKQFELQLKEIFIKML